MIDQMAPSPQDKELTDLSIIGVRKAAQNEWPSVAGFPRKFNRQAIPIWTEMLLSEDFKRKASAEPTRDEVWHLAIQEFLRLCAESGVYPFPGNTDTTQNEYVQDFVRRARLAIVHFVEKVDFFNGLTVRKVFRQYARTENGLILHCWAELFPLRNYPSFRTWLVTSPLPRFIKTVNNKYVKVILPNHVNMWVRYLNDQRVTVGFSIRVTGTVNVPGNKAPTRQEVDDFLDRTVWLPIARANRFRAVKNRLF